MVKESQVFTQTNKKNLGKVLRILRISNNMTASNVGNTRKISVSHLSEIENAKKNISFEKLEELLLIYNFSLTQMIQLLTSYNNLSKQGTLKQYQLTLLKALEMQ